MSPEELSELQKKVEKIVIDAGDYAYSRWEGAVAMQKGDEGDVVTEVDKIIEREISSKLQWLVTDAKIMGEEFGGETGSGFVWLIDPIDGTKHFAHGMPNYFTQVSLIFESEPILGVIYDPIAKHLFSASKGNGAFLNGKKLICGESISLDKAVVDIDFGGKEDVEWKTGVFGELAKNAYRVRVSGGRFAQYLLTGGINALLVVNPTTKLWDQAPRIILFREAGFDVRKTEKNGHAVWVMAEKNLANKIWEIIDSVQ